MVLPKPNTAEVELFGERLTLSERSTGQAYDLQEFVKHNVFSDDLEQFVFQTAAAISQALENNHKRLKWWQVWKRIKYRRITRPSYIKNNLTTKQLTVLFTQILQLERMDNQGDEKKKEKRSAEPSRVA